MTPQAFTTKLVDAYQRARLPLYVNDKLYRGESRSVASEIEDLLALYLVDNVPRIGSIRINQPMCITVHGRRRTIKPDLVLFRDGEVRALVDLKMDLGYKREEILKTFSQASDRMLAMRGQSATFWDGRSSSGGVRRTAACAAAAVYIFVVVSDQNITQSAYSRAEAAARCDDALRLHTLLRGVHPNSHSLPAAEIKSRSQPQLERTLADLTTEVANAVA
ncbi:MAG: hypothetical protein ABT20_14520 [Rubrivivax sp. SCN 70-15]|nr:MAG: hypothetical protein ABT20_14520 [Rubrivivax sp. SCN 70-15]